MDWLIGPEVRRFIITHNLFFVLLFVGRLIGFTALEVLRPARTVFYRKVILYDLAVFAVYQALVFPGALRINHWIAVRPHLPAALVALPLAVRVLCYLVHHSDRPEHYAAKLAALFTVWDRIFGTYVDPDTLQRELSFGIDEKVPLARLALGL